jgi:hypothetical protein
MDYLKLVTPSVQSEPDESCQDVVSLLEGLLADARAGKLTGIAGVRIYRDRHYTYGVTGETVSNPTFTRGMLKVLDDHIASLIQAQSK